nr:hypothetical protein [Tanacetum cinerariifolium]
MHLPGLYEVPTSVFQGALTWWNSHIRIVGRLQTRGSLKTLPETTKADSSLLKGKMWQGHMLHDLVIGNSMQGLDLCAPNAISMMTVHILQDATSATGLATYLVTVGARQMPMLPTIRGVMGVGNKMHKAFPLPGESSHWQYKFPLPVEGVPTAKRMEIPLPGV